MSVGTAQRPLGLRLFLWMKAKMMRHLPLMITCRQFEDFIVDYLDGDLPDRQRFVFELHLKMCKECRAYLAAYQRTIDVSQQAFAEPDDPVPTDVPEDLVKAILAAKNG